MSRAAKVQTTGLRERGSQKKERAEQMGVQRQTARLVRAECGLQPFLDLAPGSAATPTKASSGQRLNHQAANCPGLMGAKDAKGRKLRPGGSTAWNARQNRLIGTANHGRWVANWQHANSHRVSEA